MELTWLDDFLALEQTRNFTRAATLRHTTQSAYSRRIARLEEWLGCALFERNTRPVNLTAQGQEFLSRARLLRTDIMDTRRALQVLGSHYADSLRIYTTNTLASGFLPRFMTTRETRPYTVLVASVTGCLDALTAGRCDAVLVPSFKGDIWPDLFTSSVVGQDSLKLMALPDVAHTVHLQKNKLCGKIMMYTPGVRFGKMVTDMMDHHHLALAAPPVCECASAEGLAAQAAAGMGAAFIPHMLAGPGLVTCDLPKKLSMPYEILLLERSK
jgi:LysR family transcriptional regulator, hypochlorite-specific transcription factor HypT